MPYQQFPPPETDTFHGFSLYGKMEGETSIERNFSSNATIITAENAETEGSYDFKGNVVRVENRSSLRMNTQDRMKSDFSTPIELQYEQRKRLKPSKIIPTTKQFEQPTNGFAGNADISTLYPNDKINHESKIFRSYYDHLKRIFNSSTPTPPFPSGFHALPQSTNNLLKNNVSMIPNTPTTINTAFGGQSNFPINFPQNSGFLPKEGMQVPLIGNKPTHQNIAGRAPIQENIIGNIFQVNGATNVQGLTAESNENIPFQPNSTLNNWINPPNQNLHHKFNTQQANCNTANSVQLENFTGIYPQYSVANENKSTSVASEHQPIISSLQEVKATPFLNSKNELQTEKNTPYLFQDPVRTPCVNSAINALLSLGTFDYSMKPGKEIKEFYTEQKNYVKTTKHDANKVSAKSTASSLRKKYKKKKAATKIQNKVSNKKVEGTNKKKRKKINKSAELSKDPSKDKLDMAYSKGKLSNENTSKADSKKNLMEGNCRVQLLDNNTPKNHYKSCDVKNCTTDYNRNYLEKKGADDLINNKLLEGNNNINNNEKCYKNEELTVRCEVKSKSNCVNLEVNDVKTTVINKKDLCDCKSKDHYSEEVPLKSCNHIENRTNPKRKEKTSVDEENEIQKNVINPEASDVNKTIEDRGNKKNSGNSTVKRNNDLKKKSILAEKGDSVNEGRVNHESSFRRKVRRCRGKPLQNWKENDKILGEILDKIECSVPKSVGKNNPNDADESKNDQRKSRRGRPRKSKEKKKELVDRKKKTNETQLDVKKQNDEKKQNADDESSDSGSDVYEDDFVLRDKVLKRATVPARNSKHGKMYSRLKLLSVPILQPPVSDSMIKRSLPFLNELQSEISMKREENFGESYSDLYPVASFLSSYDVKVIYFTMQAKASIGQYDEAKLFCRNTLKEWTLNAKRILAQCGGSALKPPDLEFKADHMIKAVGGLWCAYAHFVLDITNTPKILDDTSFFAESNVHDIDNKIGRTMRTCKEDEKRLTSKVAKKRKRKNHDLSAEVIATLEGLEEAYSLLNEATQCPVASDVAWVWIAKSRLLEKRALFRVITSIAALQLSSANHEKELSNSTKKKQIALSILSNAFNDSRKICNQGLSFPSIEANNVPNISLSEQNNSENSNVIIEADSKTVPEPNRLGVLDRQGRKFLCRELNRVCFRHRKITELLSTSPVDHGVSRKIIEKKESPSTGKKSDGVIHNSHELPFSFDPITKEAIEDELRRGEAFHESMSKQESIPYDYSSSTSSSRLLADCQNSIQKTEPKLSFEKNPLVNHGKCANVVDKSKQNPNKTVDILVDNLSGINVGILESNTCTIEKKSTVDKEKERASVKTVGEQEKHQFKSVDLDLSGRTNEIKLKKPLNENDPIATANEGEDVKVCSDAQNEPICSIDLDLSKQNCIGVDLGTIERATCEDTSEISDEKSAESHLIESKHLVAPSFDKITVEKESNQDVPKIPEKIKTADELVYTKPTMPELKQIKSDSTTKSTTTKVTKSHEVTTDRLRLPSKIIGKIEHAFEAGNSQKTLCFCSVCGYWSTDKTCQNSCTSKKKFVSIETKESFGLQQDGLSIISSAVNLMEDSNQPPDKSCSSPSSKKNTRQDIPPQSTLITDEKENRSSLPSRDHKEENKMCSNVEWVCESCHTGSFPEFRALKKHQKNCIETVKKSQQAKSECQKSMKKQKSREKDILDIFTSIVEFHQATKKDLFATSYSKNKQIEYNASFVGQIGLRCKWCAGGKHSGDVHTIYPRSVSQLHRGIWFSNVFHWRTCNALPPQIMKRLKFVNKSTKFDSARVKQYWKNIAEENGLKDDVDGGIRRDDSYEIASESQL